jgi:hypothetical protein
MPLPQQALLLDRSECGQQDEAIFEGTATMSDNFTLSGEIPPELQARVQAELTPEEKLVWLGQPEPSTVVRSARVLVIVGLVWTIGSIFFALHWLKMADDFNRHWNAAPGVGAGGFERRERGFFDYLPWLFVLIGVGIMTSPFWMLRKARQTCYALTNQRALICQPGWFGAWNTSSYTAPGLGKMRRRERADGTGDLIFEEVTSTSTNSEGHSSTTTTWRGFLNIARVREVEALVRSTLLTGERI